MSTTQQKTRGALGVVLLIAYSVIMMVTSGEAASWAWLLLAASLVLIGTAARPAFGSTRQDDR
jgi:O-antigen ligase